ncbi:scopoletin glucosyltransferase [Trifolium repens]|nr:scopoletin glucosyltransferase [Trifolium repens]
MGNEYQSLHIFFFPFLAHGHIIPTVDMAKLFAEKGVKATIITTPLNKPFISKSIEKSIISGHNIHIQTINFPCIEAGLQNGCENIDSIPSLEFFSTFFKATNLLQEPLEELLHKKQPDCIVADMFFPWTTDSAAKFGIPRLVFHGISYFSLCATECIRLYEPFKNVSSDSEAIVIPNLPGDIKITRLQTPPIEDSKELEGMVRLMQDIKESEVKSFGVVVNSFYDLENDYADYYINVLGRKSWHIGPLCLYNRDIEEKVNRGKKGFDHDMCLKWLDMKKSNSVVYICFGSIAKFPNSQLQEIAIGLEASGQNFIWVVPKSDEDWKLEEFEKRMEGKGLIIRGWAPQVLILEHEAIAAFVTHCGWNSILEGVAAGVPMVTWPIAAEQFYNEKLVNEVLKIGVPVGVKKWVGFVGDSVEWDAIEKVVKRIMEGEGTKEMRNKVKVLSELAKRAMKKEGSSYSNLDDLIEELGLFRH